MEEERYRRIKHEAGFPGQSLHACLEMGGLTAADIDIFAVSRNPRAHLLRKALFALRHRPRGTIASRARNLASVHALPGVIADALDLDPVRVRRRTRIVEHHPAHLASAAFVSPFDESAICAIDGFGDFVSTSWGRLRGSRIAVDGHVYRRPRHYPQTLQRQGPHVLLLQLRNVPHQKRRGGAGFPTLPTAAYRMGDFSQALTSRQLGVDPLGRPILEGEIYNPNTTRVVNGQTVRDPFPGNIIPANRIDPVAARIQALIPNPTSSGNVNNFAVSDTVPT